MSRRRYNPAGTLMSRELQQELVQLAEEHGMYILSDEVCDSPSLPVCPSAPHGIRRRTLEQCTRTSHGRTVVASRSRWQVYRLLEHARAPEWLQPTRLHAKHRARRVMSADGVARWWADWRVAGRYRPVASDGGPLWARPQCGNPQQAMGRVRSHHWLDCLSGSVHQAAPCRRAGAVPRSNSARWTAAHCATQGRTPCLIRSCLVDARRQSLLLASILAPHARAVRASCRPSWCSVQATPFLRRI